jgi:hypothetical protein
MREVEFLEPGKLPFVEIASREEMPHLYKDGTIYFVTKCARAKDREGRRGG